MFDTHRPRCRALRVPYSQDLPKRPPWPPGWPGYAPRRHGLPLARLPRRVRRRGRRESTDTGALAEWIAGAGETWPPRMRPFDEERAIQLHRVSKNTIPIVAAARRRKPMSVIMVRTRVAFPGDRATMEMSQIRHNLSRAHRAKFSMAAFPSVYCRILFV